MTTFRDMNIPFPLFEAPAAEAEAFAGLDTCTICARERVPCFELEIGADVVVRCGSCGLGNGLDADDRSGGRCRGCGEHLPFPYGEQDALLACHDCLRGGRCSFTQDTELGMVTWDNSVEGLTHGLPCPGVGGFPSERSREGWWRYRVPREDLSELVRTPSYLTIQGERWMFCCMRPMVYSGAWDREEFAARSPDGDGKGYFEAIVEDTVDGLWEDELHDETGAYVFRCSICGKHRAHWDIA